jgi:glutamate-1-semialdehyde 2,1-aminomutase
MEHLAPLGPCYQAGTLSGNPVAVAAGIANLKLAAVPDFYAIHGARLTGLIDGLRAAATRHRVPFQVAQAGMMWGYFFSDAPVTDFASAQRQHDGRWQVFFREMTARGIFLPPSPYEASFFSSAHGDVEIRATLQAADAAFAAVA